MGIRTTLSRALKHLSTPLLPDDYTHLVNPLWSRRELRGRIERIMPTSPTTAELVIRPGWAVPTDFHAGQFLGIGVQVNGKYLWRSYSLTNPPQPKDGLLTINVRALDDGYVSKHLVSYARPGTVVRLAAPAGDFHLPNPVPARIAFVTAGSGVTPVISMLRDLSRRGIRAEVAHLHSYRGDDEAVFVDELRTLADDPGALTYRLALRNTAEQPRIDAAVVTQTIADFKSLASSKSAYACGPAGLLETLEEAFPGVRTERFVLARTATTAGGTVSFGSRGDVNVDGATTILEASEQIGVNLPHGCRMGICATCVQQLAAGTARDIRNGTTFEAGERIRTCVCTPVGDAALDL
ncbi:MAG: ferredoxin reductase [Corynebacterium sp.]|uniref:ferredoxin reductase n=1 Tax=Corynebacterium sp. TaxID=1720 RepID=UPI0026DD4405|nr:ferredoxin reductase [Corynebacterium sp.]MDO5031003.1 ferredoxin reductase [Corynebacterium sp.]